MEEYTRRVQLLCCVYVLHYLEENVVDCDCADIKPTLVPWDIHTGR